MTIISFQKNYIFIKTQKTAGTSIEVDLSATAGDDAIVTPIWPSVSGHTPRNFDTDSNHSPYYNHMPAHEVEAKLGESRFNEMYRFCVEREPVDKCISHFHMLRNSPLHNPDGTYQLSWDEYCEAGKFPIDLGRYSKLEAGRRRLMVNNVLRYDALQMHLKQVMDHLGVSGFNLVSRAKSEYSKNVLIRKEEVTPEQRALILERYRATLELIQIDWAAPPQPLILNI